MHSRWIGVSWGLWLMAGHLVAGGLLPDRDNLIVIEGEFSQSAPAFRVIFSARPLRGAPGSIQTLSTDEWMKLKSNAEMVILTLDGKGATTPGRYEYFFGTKRDAQQPWNNGPAFRWQQWENVSPEVWDNIAIAAAPESAAAKMIVRHVTVRKGGQLLFNSRGTASYPNKQRIDASFAPLNLAHAAGRVPLLNLAASMERFRRDYYELGQNPILWSAYADLGQTEKRKYASRGKNWCSEFATHLYRQNNIPTPDPNRGDVHWKNVREFFAQNGKVYTAREVASWPDAKKVALIKPGSFVSILIGDNTHSIIFTTWVRDKRQPIRRYVGVSGNNRGMVWSHAPLKLPDPGGLKNRSPEELRDFDQKVYFGVPNR
jgi:hypothetical protein